MIPLLSRPPGVAPRADQQPVDRPEAPPPTRFSDLLGPGAGPAPADTALARPLAAEAPEQAIARQAASAERFNEHGFFGKAVPAEYGDAAFDADAGAVREAARAEASDALAEPDVPVAAGTFPPVEGNAGGGPGKPAALTPAGKMPIRASGRQAGPVTTGFATLRAEASEADLVRPAGRRLLAGFATRAAHSAARVALSETERGIHVMAVASALSVDERLRLADEIAALLSRHGLVPASIKITARPAPEPSV